MDECRAEIEKALDLSRHLRFDKKHPWHRNLVVLYGAILEYTDTLVHLIDARKAVSVPVVMRSLVEAFVDFKNLAEDRGYGNTMEASYHHEWLRVLRSADGAESPYLASIGRAPELEGQIRDHEEKLQTLKDRGFNPISNRSKFETAGMLDEYLSIYNFLCSYSHNNIRSLIERFMEIDRESEEINIVFFRDYDVENFDHYLSTAVSLLRQASRNLHIILQSGHEAAFPE